MQFSYNVPEKLKEKKNQTGQCLRKTGGQNGTMTEGKEMENNHFSVEHYQESCTTTSIGS